MASSAEPARNPVSGALLSSADVARVVDRMAHQLIERAAASDPGHRTAASPPSSSSASRPAARRWPAGWPPAIEAFSGTPVDVGTVDITLYRDDLRLRGVRALEPTVLPDGGIDGRLVVLVDDVLFSGRSVRAALDALRDLGRPRARAAGRPGRPRPPRAADPGRLRRQEHADLAQPAGARCGWPRSTAPTRSCVDRRGTAVKRHLLAAADLDRADATLVLDTAAQIDQALAGREVKKLPTLRGRTVVNLFYEDSTRTRISFELAAKRLSRRRHQLLRQGLAASPRARASRTPR